MKKKALCAFILVFWMLIACTMLSVKVEEQMIPQVTTIEPDRSGYTNPELPIDCLQFDDYGMHLFTTYEGTGWEAGTRVKEEQAGSYEIGEETIKPEYAWGTFVQYTSKPLKSGELVEVQRGGDRIPDYWLGVFTDDKPDFSSLPEGIAIEEENEKAVLLSVENAQQPYMDGRAKSVVPQLFSANAYSFSEMQKFLDTLPYAGLALGLLIAAVTLWACSCFLTKKAKYYKVSLMINFCLGIGMLFCLHLTLGMIDLPSSMLPRQHITDFGYFVREYSEFFNTLKSFAPTPELGSNLPDSEAARAIIGYKNITIMRPFIFMALGVIVPAIVVLAERGYMYWRDLPRLK